MKPSVKEMISPNALVRIFIQLDIVQQKFMIEGRLNIDFLYLSFVEAPHIGGDILNEVYGRTAEFWAELEDKENQKFLRKQGKRFLDALKFELLRAKILEKLRKN